MKTRLQMSDVKTFTGFESVHGHKMMPWDDEHLVCRSWLYTQQLRDFCAPSVTIQVGTCSSLSLVTRGC